MPCRGYIHDLCIVDSHKFGHSKLVSASSIHIKNAHYSPVRLFRVCPSVEELVHTPYQVHSTYWLEGYVLGDCDVERVELSLDDIELCLDRLYCVECVS
jgi:hypothetical protein